MGPIERLMKALEAEDIDILSPDAETEAFGNSNDKSNSSTQDQDSEVGELEEGDDSDDSDIQDEGENGETIEPVNEDEIRIKNNTKIRMKHLYDIVSSNLDKFISLNHDIKNFDIKKYSIIESKFTELKNNLFRFITDDEFISKDCASYKKYYITSKELYNICIEMTDLFFQEYNKTKEREGKNNKQKYKDKK